jgi:hypothetical protein
MCESRRFTEEVFRVAERRGRYFTSQTVMAGQGPMQQRADARPIPLNRPGFMHRENSIRSAAWFWCEKLEMCNGSSSDLKRWNIASLIKMAFGIGEMLAVLLGKVREAIETQERIICNIVLTWVPNLKRGDNMDSGFIDLDILLTRIREPRSKVYFLEATKSYKAGALRAALAAIWVAVVYDLIMKYRELAAKEDRAANEFLKKWDAANDANNVQKLLELERTIINDAVANTQIINRNDETQLTRLRDDRNLCAHPAYSTETDLFEPTPELVRLHLVNAINLVLSQWPLQGKAIVEQFGTDLTSVGFPVSSEKVQDYVEQRYLARIRPQSIKNFGTVLVKSLLKGTPPEWEIYRHKIIASLAAVRDRSPDAWAEIADMIVRLINVDEPQYRLRVVTFLGAFSDFWDRLDAPTRIALESAVANLQVDSFEEYRILYAAKLPQFRVAILNLIKGMNPEQVRTAISEDAFIDLWERGLEFYRDSGSYRGSEANFLSYIHPYAPSLSSQQLDALLEAVKENDQNWSAAMTPELLLSVLKSLQQGVFPSQNVRNVFFTNMTHYRQIERYDAVIQALRADGWVPTPVPQDDDY